MEVGVIEHVELSIPARPDFLYLARLHVGAIASRADLSVDDVEDLHLAVEELCMSVLHLADRGGGRLLLDVEWDEVDLHVRCSQTESDEGDAAGDDGTCFPSTISRRLLDALVDEHGVSSDGERPVAWLRKRRRAE
jgi:hypothetical protein